MQRRRFKFEKAALPEQCVDFGHASVEPRKGAVIVTPIAILSTDAHLLSNCIVVRGDDSTFIRNQQLGGAQAKDLNVALPPNWLSLMQRSEGMRSVKDKMKAVAVG